MKFRFCNDLDCPDWTLVQIAQLSKLSSVKLKLVCGIVVKSLLGEELPVDKLEKLTADISSDCDDFKGIIAVLEFIIATAAKNQCDANSLNQELQQLGLPAEHSNSLSKVYCDAFSSLVLHGKEVSFRLPSLKCTASTCHKFSSVSGEASYVEIKGVVHSLGKRENRNLTAFLSPEKLHSLIYELKQAAAIMESLQ